MAKIIKDLKKSYIESTKKSILKNIIEYFYFFYNTNIQDFLEKSK